MLLGLLALFIGQLSGSTLVPIGTKLAIQYTSPLIFLFIRFFFAAILFSPFLFFTKQKKLVMSDYKKLLLLAALLFINVSSFTIGIQFTTVLMSQILYATTPIVVGVLAQVFLKEKLTKEKMIGLIIAICGFGFLFYQSAVTQGHLTFGTPLGNGIILFGMLGYSGWILYSRSLITSKRYSSSQLTFFTFLFIALYVLLLSPLDRLLSASHMLHVTSIGTLYGLLVAAGSVIMYFLIQIGIQRTNAFTVSLFQYLGPFLAGTFSTIILHEKLTVSLLLGGTLIICGVFYATSYTYLKQKLHANK